MSKIYPLEGRGEYIRKLVNDYCKWVEAEDMSTLPTKKMYRIQTPKEPAEVEASARKASLESMCYQASKKMVKLAFDTRRIDQDNQVNPRRNLQYYNRSQQYVDAEINKRMSAFAELMPVLNTIKNKYGSQPEYFDSYANQLHDLVHRVLQVKEAELNVFRPQVEYLEQLLYARYRLTPDDLRSLSQDELEQRIIAKDESLLKRGRYLQATQAIQTPKPKQATLSVKDGNQTGMQENLVNAIFGNNEFRRDGEKTVERTITITIRDNVLDE